MSSRAVQILANFPAHFEATRPDKQLRFVADGLAEAIDLLSADLSNVRRAHRLAHADTARDLALLAGLHGIGADDLDVLRRKQTRLRELADALEQAVSAGAAARDAAAKALLDLFAVDSSVDRLALLAPDRDAAAKKLASSVRAAVAFQPSLDAARTRIATICRIHARGNGTVRALIEGAANALDLTLDESRNRAVRAELLGQPTLAAELHPSVDDGLFHSRDLFWHSSFVQERLVLAAPLDGGQPLPIVGEALGLEENPLRREFWPLSTATPPGPTTLALPKQQAGLSASERWRFNVQRRGFGRELLRIVVTGVADKTVGPMLVNRDEGRGIGWSGSVPDQKSLMFTEAGRVLLDGVDVTTRAYSWSGACFGLPLQNEATDDNLNPKHDFVFDGPGLDAWQRTRVATFAVASPPGALDREALFPHAGDPVTAPGIGIGRTRLAFFLQEAHLSGDKVVTPRPLIGFAGDRDDPTAAASVFALSPPDAVPPTAALLSLSWLEHEAYALRVLIPKRFALLDGEGPTVSERVRRALERFRPGGVEVRVEYSDDSWVLGSGFLVGHTLPDPNLQLRGGTVLSPAP